MNRERELLVNGLIAFLLEYCAKDSGKICKGECPIYKKSREKLWNLLYLNAIKLTSMTFCLTPKILNSIYVVIIAAKC